MQISRVIEVKGRGPVLVLDELPEPPVKRGDKIFFNGDLYQVRNIECFMNNFGEAKYPVGLCCTKID